MKTIEYKSIDAKVKDVDEEKRIVTGFYTGTGIKDSDKDIFPEGAFKKTIKERGPKGTNEIWHFYNHDQDQAINNPKLLDELRDGVYFETFFPKNAIADYVLSIYAAGGNFQHSVGYIPMDEEFQKDETRIIKQAMLWEGSTVIWGANSKTPFTGLKTQKVKEQLEILEKIYRNASFEKEKTFELLYREIERLKGIIIEPGTSHSTEPPPVKKALPYSKIIINKQTLF